MNQLRSVFKYLPEIDDLPLILAGPILRRTESRAVTVWLALKQSSSISLEVYATESGNGETIGEAILQGQDRTIKLGQNLYIVALTAKPIGDRYLVPGQIYAYNLYFERGDKPETCLLEHREQLLTFQDDLSYFPHRLPTFSLPPVDINHLRIVHGSCRKPHGGGRDSLSCLDNLIQESAHNPDRRPHQLFLTGDQIYGDDVADPMLWLIEGVGKLLFDRSEELPLQQGTILSEELAPGKRSEIARIEGGFTAMLHNKPEKAKSHLFSFAEYAVAYLLAWSPTFMPSNFPSGQSLFSDRQKSKNWEREVYATESFIRDLGSVRKALANIPVYTICDDHDISDDWYLNRQWCDRVLSKPLGRRVVQNGLLAYALFQAWGNTPELFEPKTAGNKLLQLISQWLASNNRDASLSSKIDCYLGIPPLDRNTGLPKLEADRNVLILSRDSQAIPWYYTLRSTSHEVIVLDTRTWRGYPSGKERGLDPPMLLCPKAFERQLEIPLAETEPNIEATIVVLPTNLVTLKIIDRIQQWELSRDRVFSTDVGDSWNFHQPAFAQLLLSLCQKRDRVIILSGDIHYSCAIRLTYWFHQPFKTSVLVQLTSSAIKNSEATTRLVHTKIKALLPESTERWLGWQQPLKLVKLSQFTRRQKSSDSQTDQSLPDWQYRIEWCKRQPSRPLPWKQPRLQINARSNLWQKLITTLLSWLWRNRWLQEGTEVVGRNNLSLVKFQWSTTKSVVQETYWHPPWNDMTTVKTCYEVSLESEPLPPMSGIEH